MNVGGWIQLRVRTRTTPAITVWLSVKTEHRSGAIGAEIGIVFSFLFFTKVVHNILPMECVYTPH